MSQKSFYSARCYTWWVELSSSKDKQWGWIICKKREKERDGVENGKWIKKVSELKRKFGKEWFTRGKVW